MKHGNFCLQQPYIIINACLKWGNFITLLTSKFLLFQDEICALTDLLIFLWSLPLMLFNQFYDFFLQKANVYACTSLASCAIRSFFHYISLIEPCIRQITEALYSLFVYKPNLSNSLSFPVAFNVCFYPFILFHFCLQEILPLLRLVGILTSQKIHDFILNGRFHCSLKQYILFQGDDITNIFQLQVNAMFTGYKLILCTCDVCKSMSYLRMATETL